MRFYPVHDILYPWITVNPQGVTLHPQGVAIHPGRQVRASIGQPLTPWQSTSQIPMTL